MSTTSWVTIRKPSQSSRVGARSSHAPRSRMVSSRTRSALVSGCRPRPRIGSGRSQSPPGKPSTREEGYRARSSRRRKRRLADVSSDAARPHDEASILMPSLLLAEPNRVADLALAALLLLAAFFALRPEIWGRIFFERVDPRPAGLLRIAFGLVTLWTFLALLPLVRVLFTDEGLWLTDMARERYGGPL